jgi:hypothetical protein
MIGRGSRLPRIHPRRVAGIRPGQAMHRPMPRMINLAYRLRNGPGPFPTSPPAFGRVTRRLLANKVATGRQVPSTS